MPTPKRCSTAVPDEKPKANNSGFAAHGISIPWANPWNAPKNATAIIIIIVGNFFSIATDKPKKITNLTFKDIKIIKNILKMKLRDIYHLRIKYPED